MAMVEASVRSRAAAIILAAYALLGGLVSFAGWPLDAPALTDWIGKGISIQPNTALAAALAGAALILLAAGWHRASAALGAVVAAIGATALIQIVTGADFGPLNTLLTFGRTWGRGGVIVPGRMGPPGATCLTLVGTAVTLAAAARTRRARRIVSGLGLTTLAIATLSIAGYVYGADLLYAMPSLSVIALQTATFIAAASAAVIASVPEHPPMRWLIDPGATGVVARRALPFVLLVPFVLGWLRLRGETLGLYEPRFGVAIFVVVLIALLLSVVWWSLTTIARHEAAVRASESRTIDMLESLTDGFMTFDAQWRFRFVNREAARMLHRSREELIGTSLWEAFPESDGGRRDHELHRAAALRVSVEFESFSPALNRWFLNKAYPTPGDGIAVYFQDITERKQFKQQLDADIAAIRRLQALSTQLVRAGELQPLLTEILATSADLTGTLKGNIQFYDPETGKLRIVVHQGLGARVIRRFAAEGWAPTCGEAANQLARVIVEDIAALPDAFGVAERDLLLTDGIRAVQSTPLVSRDGRLLGMLNNHYPEPGRPDERSLRLIDVLARQAADLIERSQAEEALSDAARRKDEFLATLAHELRNPLAPVTNSLALMRQAGGDMGVIERARGTMERQIAQMVRLIDDLLDVNRITRNKLELARERIELAPVIQHAVEASRPLYEAAGHRLDILLPSEPIYVDADPMRLAQVFGNLLTNAGKYTKPGGRIILYAERRGGDVAVGVKDNGVGIPRDMLPHVFDMFTQVDRTLDRSDGGLGIGLALVKRLVELHGGTVTASSRGPGFGSEFVVQLRAAPPPQAAEPVEKAKADTAASRRILVVDDNTDSATSLAMLLKLAGHDTFTAHDGVQALEMAEQIRPHAVLLDIGLPKLNGYDTCRLIRQHPWGKGVLMVALTGWGQTEDRRRSTEAGFDSHMVKPVDHDALMELLALRRFE